jgi:hypothetical protein
MPSRMKPTWGLARVVSGYLSATAIVAVAAFAVPAMAQTAGNPVELYSFGQHNSAANPVYGSLSGTGTVTGVDVTTAATAGTPSTIAAAGVITKGFTLQNNCTTAIWWSNSLAAGTTLSASNSMGLAAGASFTSPDWWPPSGALIVASQTAFACAVGAAYK